LPCDSRGREAREIVVRASEDILVHVVGTKVLGTIRGGGGFEKIILRIR
jgi:hypothetical protein